MKIRILKICLLLLWSASYSAHLFAHPLDISSTTITLHDDRAAGITYFHNYEITSLLHESGKKIIEVADIFEHKEIIREYFLSHFQFSNQGEYCNIENIDIPHLDGYIVLSTGIEVKFTILCTKRIQEIEVNLDFFTNFDLQTNRLYFLESDGTEVFFKVGTAKVTNIPYTRGIEKIYIDSDGDGLSDEEEKAYHTDPNKIDTDEDNYTDSEEVYSGWNPLSKSPSPGQSERQEIPKDILNIIEKRLKPKTNTDYTIAGTTIGSSLFQDILRKIGKTISQEESHSFGMLFIGVMLLGFLHALGPGHAKSLLGALMVHRNSSFGTGVRFIFIFSITHIIDIVILFFILQFLLNYMDAGTLLGWIQRVSSVILLFFGIYLLYRARFVEKVDDTEDCKSLGGKKTWILGIITGLAPCSFGWSLFFLLLSLGKISWIPWFILAIGIGIFLCLFSILIVLYFTRKVFYTQITVLARYSGYLSGILIFSIGFILTYNNFIL